MARRPSYDGLEVGLGPYRVTLTVRPLEGEYGNFSERPARITVAEGLDPITRGSVVIHELIHYVDSVVGLGLSEQKTRALEAALVTLISQNPGLASLLVRDLTAGE